MTYEITPIGTLHCSEWYRFETPRQGVFAENRGYIELDGDSYAEAAADLDKATTLKPKHAKAHQLFGDALYALKKEDEAALHWEIAERLRDEKNNNSKE